MFDTTPTKEATYSQPTMNSFTRVRSAKKKPKSKAVFAGAGARKTKDPKKVTVEQRLKEFPGQTLCKSGLVLFCRGCSHTLPLLKSSVKTHIDSKMHKQAVVEYLKSRGEDEEIKQYLTDHYAANPHESGGTVDLDTQVHRWRLVACFMSAGIALNKANEMRPFLQRGDKLITDASHLGSYIPKVTAAEKALVSKETAGQLGCIIFDGTSRCGEAIVILWKQCTGDFNIQLRLVACKTTEVHVNGNDLAGVLASTVLTDLRKLPADVIGDARDSAAVNGVASRLLQQLMPALEGNKCIAHLLQGSGQHVKLPFLGLFMAYLIQLLSSSHSFKIIFKETMGESMPGYSPIRWWSRWVLMHVLARCFSKIGALLTKLEQDSVGPATTSSMREIWDAHKTELRRELAMVLDLKVLADCTYELEGDSLVGLLLPFKIEAIRSLGRNMAGNSSTMPNLAAVLREEAVIGIGTKVIEYYGSPFDAWFKGSVTATVL